MEAWQDATEMGLEGGIDLALSKPFYVLLSGVWWQVQGCFKSEAKLIIKATYSLIHSDKKVDIRENKNKYKMLTTGAKMPYTCKDPENLKGHWYSCTAFSLICHVCFATPCLNGFQCADYFYPFLLPLIALAYAAVKCAIDEWVKGEWTAVEFRGDAYQHEYCTLLANLCGLMQLNEMLKQRFREDYWQAMHQPMHQEKKVKVTLGEEDQEAALCDFEECIKHQMEDVEGSGSYSDS
ncbi:hypothetical protein FRB95_014878 [Tulasnella sp. JGI-2019a]|nr:hypothetical protein FRB95_014878 [Tulasnella sp. JGI-2019a]